MKKLSKAMTIIASSMIVVGILLAVIGLSAGAKLSITNSGAGFKVWDPEDRKVETFPLSAFTSMDVNMLDADIEIIPSNEYKLLIERHKDQEIIHEIKNNMLIIEEKERKTSNFFNIGLGFVNTTQTKIKIYIPNDTNLSEVTLVNNFGDIRIDGMIAEKLDIHAADGDLTMNEMEINELKMVNQFGDISGNNVSAKDLMIEMTDGDAVFNTISTDSVVMKNGFGDTTFKNLTSQGMNIESNDGDIEIHGLLLGTSIIHSSFGDVNMKLMNKEAELSYNIHNNFGDITINDNEFNTKAVQKVDSKDNLEITSKDGDVEIIYDR